MFKDIILKLVQIIVKFSIILIFFNVQIGGNIVDFEGFKSFLNTSLMITGIDCSLVLDIKDFFHLD